MKFESPVAVKCIISIELIQHHNSLADNYMSFVMYVDPKNVPLLLLHQERSLFSMLFPSSPYFKP
jgi:hypothetical protein